MDTEGAYDEAVNTRVRACCIVNLEDNAVPCCDRVADVTCQLVNRIADVTCQLVNRFFWNITYAKVGLRDGIVRNAPTRSYASRA